MLSQKQVKDLVFVDIAAAKAAGRPSEICYVQSMKTFYDYVVAGSGYTANDTSILTTGNGGNTRWIARAGQLNITEAEIVLDAAGAVTVTQMRHKVDTFENAASDDLVTLNGGAAINMVVLRAENAARTIVVKHGTGNIWLQGKADISLDDLEDGILLFWDSTNSKWFDIGGGGGGAGDVTAAANITDEALVLGDGGAKGIKALALGAANSKLFMNAAGTANEYASGISIGRFTRDTAIASGTQAISGIGFKPFCVIFLAAVENSKQASWGFDRCSTRLSIVVNREGGLGTYQTLITKSMSLYQAAGVDYTGKITTLGADGFTITWTKGGAKTGIADIYYLAFR